ncbi:acetyl-CoA carboxylase biotin carboxyl carrier protein [Paraburkholderia unamae]|uniref:acetyl-CoA carboxylase biotin carboxyl carrier protein n=1 Tax=Paraburkholderia unamae TaxID=219649 RepID=UPI000DC3B868|nr:biotin/lipoyl-containing protein [Paraburkholderia unamae]RAR54278.1 acetyl-CoA carboxylase biotin carboxyl carrier protein [Paraburkholderia unamae]
MNQELIDGLIRLLERSSLDVIEYTNGDERIKLVRGGGERSPPHKADSVAAIARPSAAQSPGSQAASPAAQAQHVIPSGMTGTFYRAPGPDQPVFASPGDLIEEGHTLGLVEAMKLLNPIEADRAGRLIEILVSDGAAVAHDTPLFVIEPI